MSKISKSRSDVIFVFEVPAENKRTAKRLSSHIAGALKGDFEVVSGEKDQVATCKLRLDDLTGNSRFGSKAIQMIHKYLGASNILFSEQHMDAILFPTGLNSKQQETEDKRPGQVTWSVESCPDFNNNLLKAGSRRRDNKDRYNIPLQLALVS